MLFKPIDLLLVLTQYYYAMKKLILLLALPFIFQSCDVVNQVATPLSTGDVSQGLKAALNLGVDYASRDLSNPSKYGGNALVNALLPASAVKIMNTASQMGFEKQVNMVTSKLNTAAQNTVKASIPIFKNSISKMSFNDAWGILKGGSGAGTDYLQRTSGAMLNSAISQQVKSAFNQAGLKTNLLANFGVNSPMLSALNIDIAQPLTKLVSDQIFKSIKTQENKIRSDVSARPTLLLQKVFAAANLPK